MNIKHKQYRNIIPLVSFDNYHQDYIKKDDIFQYFYFYSSYAISSKESVFQSNQINIFQNRISNNREEPEEFEISKENSIYHSYYIENDNVSIIWKPYIKGKKIIMEFKGKILLKGDAIQGTTFRNGIPVFPERVYYNINKPLPNNLIENEKKIQVVFYKIESLETLSLLRNLTN